MKPEPVHISRSRTGVAAALLILAAWATGCGRGDAPSPPRPEPRGTALVVGTSAAEWGLLSIPISGGTAELRTLADPATPAWTSEARLPASAEAHVIDGNLVVLRGVDGTVSRFDPADESFQELDEKVDGDSVAWTTGDVSGVFRAGSGLLQVGRESAWRYVVDGSVRWAAPADEGVVALVVGGNGPELRMLRPNADEPVASLRLPLAPPGLVTAWGRRLVLTEPDRSDKVEILSSSPLEPLDAIDAGGTILTLAASPSSHAVYAGVEDPAAVVELNRFSGSSHRLAALDRPPLAIRPALFGGFLLVWDGQGVVQIPAEGGAPQAVSGTWRSDLPVGLPSGAVVTLRGDDVVIAGSAGNVRIEGGGDRWWLLVRWNPSSGVSVAPVAARPADSTVTPETRSPPGGETTTGRRPPTEEELPEVAPPPEVPYGFYAIVGSARARAGIAELVSELGSAGFPTEIQRIRDESGAVWFRGLVGPFDTRAGAEAASRQLERERRLQSWVTEIRPGG